MAVTKKLFAFYIGGSTATSLIELHDVRFCVAEKIEDCHQQIRDSWWGTPESLHLDCWGELTSTHDGYAVALRPDKPAQAERLYFVNLGGYDPEDFTELHKNVFVVAETESKAKVKALKTILHWKSHHKDKMFDVEHITCLNGAAEAQGLYIHLTPVEGIKPFTFKFGYNPFTKTAA